MKKLILYSFLVLCVIACEAQTQFFLQTPSGQIPYSTFNDVGFRTRADTYTGSAGSYSLTDFSGNGNNAIQQAGTLTPGTGVNGQAKFTGSSNPYLNTNFSVKNWPITIIDIVVRSNNTMTGFFGHQGASGTNTLWCGYEASNANLIYNTNGSNNTTSEAGSITCYVHRLDWGSRWTYINGDLKSVHTESSVVQSSNLSTSIGTQYRGLNCDWYETMVWTRALSISDLDEVYAYVNSRYGTSITLNSSFTDAPVIVIGGQSNASGRGNPKSYLTTTSPPYNSAQTNVFVWTNNSDYTSSSGNTWATLDESANNNMLGDGSLAATNFGYEASLGYNYINRVGGSVYLFKFAQGGTFLANTGASFWVPTDNTVAPNSGFRIYSSMMQNWADALIAFRAASKNPKIVAIIWTQGEQDATDATAAGNYQSNLISFCNTIREELGCNRLGVNVPVIITRLPNGQSGETYLSTVQTAQTNAASILTSTTLFNTDSYSFGANPHWSNASYVQLGIDLAAAIP